MKDFVANLFAGSFGIAAISFFVGLFAAWATHVIWMIQLFSGKWTILEAIIAFAGLVFPPIGVGHGIMIWIFGF